VNISSVDTWALNSSPHCKCITFQLYTFVSCPFYRAMLCIRGTIAMGLCLSVTSRCSTKTAKRRITQITPHDSVGTLVFWCKRSLRNSTRVTPNAGGVGQNRRLSTNNWLYLENGKRYTHTCSFYWSRIGSRMRCRMVALPTTLSAP